MSPIHVVTISRGAKLEEAARRAVTCADGMQGPVGVEVCCNQEGSNAEALAIIFIALPGDSISSLLAKYQEDFPEWGGSRLALALERRTEERPAIEDIHELCAA